MINAKWANFQLYYLHFDDSEMTPNADPLFLILSKPVYVLTPKRCILTYEAANTNFIVWLESMIYHTLAQQVNHYTTNVVKREVLYNLQSEVLYNLQSFDIRVYSDPWKCLNFTIFHIFWSHKYILLKIIYSLGWITDVLLPNSLKLSPFKLIFVQIVEVGGKKITGISKLEVQCKDCLLILF